MVDEFQARVCDGNRWNNNPKNVYESSIFSPIIADIGSFNWPADLMDMKARSSDESGSANNSQGSISFQEIQKPMDQESGYGDRSLWMDSNFDMMSSGLSSSITTDWNQTLMHGSKGDECNYQSFLQEDLNLSNSSCQQDDYSQITKDCNPKKYFSTIDEDSSTNAFKETNDHRDYPVSTYGYATSSLLQTLFDDTSDSPPQDSIFGNQPMDYASTKFSSSSKLSSLLKPPLPKEEPLSHLNLSNPTTFWNSSATTMNDIRASCFSQEVQSQILPPVEDKSNFSNLSTTAKSNSGDRVRDPSPVVKKNNSSEPVYKRQRIETPSPLPTFKVRKEKLGDRITALQQLVSPFGKTDTSSVLHEAIEYIKLLHDQINVLSTPYIKSVSSVQCEQMLKRSNCTQVLGVKNQNLRTRGLCLVPISSTFPVTTDTTADFWTPTFGAILR